MFQKLVKIGDLFAEGQKPEHYYKTKMLKKLKKAKYHGPVRMVTFIGVQVGVAAIVAPKHLYFWPDGQPANF